MIGKKGDFNFVLLFAIIAGAAILVLAIYGAVRTGTTIQKQSEAEISKSIQIITDPLQAGFAETKTSKIVFNQEARISNDCFSDDGFGKNQISVQVKSGIGKEWSDETTPISIHNKYIFSNLIEGKTFFVFSKPFSISYKVADLLFMDSQNYCLVSPPDEIAEDFASLGLQNFGIDGNQNYSCVENSIRVCFGQGGACNVSVFGQCTGQSCSTEYDYGYVRKGSDTFSYSGNLLYAAIFSDKNLYECNVKRLLYRTSKEAEIYSEKADLMNARGCNTQLKPNLDILSSLTQNATSDNLRDLYSLGISMNTQNEQTGCSLW